MLSIYKVKPSELIKVRCLPFNWRYLGLLFVDVDVLQKTFLSAHMENFI